MRPWFLILIAFTVVVDALVTYYVLARIRPRMMKLGRTLEERKATLRAAEVIVGEGLRQSYRGDPETLPTVLAGIAPRLNEMLTARGLTPDADVTRDLLGRSLTTHRVPAAAAREALSRLAA